MRKAISILGLAFGVLLIFGLGAANATTPTTGFELHKSVVVNGDWEWTGCWQTTYPPTATYSYDVYSPQSTISDVINDDDFGAPWKFAGHSRVESNAETDYFNGFLAWTVNPPDTTPGTDWTKYDYQEHTVSTNPSGASTQTMSINGYGNTWISSHVHTDHGSWQGVDTLVNN